MKPILTAIVGLALAMPSASSAQQNLFLEGLEWVTQSGFDDVRGQDYLTTIYRAPGSEAGIFILDCNITGAEVRADISVAWPTLGVEDGVDVPFFWRTAQGSVTQWSRVRLEDGFEGATMAVALDSFLLRELGAASAITYGINGHQGIPRNTRPIMTNQGEAFAFPDRCQALWDQTRGDITPGVLSADLGPDITGHVWDYFASVSDDVSETTLIATYAVPQTDDVAVTAQCLIGTGGPYVSLEFAADTSGLGDGDPAEVYVTGANGGGAFLQGIAVGQFAEFGISGFQASLELSDPAWLVIAADPTIRFQRVGGVFDGMTITGNGPDTLGPFLTDCARIGDLQPESGLTPLAPTTAQQGYLSCESYGRVASENTGTAMVLTFVNETEFYRSVMWIDPTGIPTQLDAGDLNPGESISFTTDVGHVWMAADGPGNCREMIRPVLGQTQYRLLVE